MRGRQTRTLRPDQIKRLEAFRRAPHDGAPHGYSLPQLRMAIGAGFGWQTLKKALQGVPVWDLHYSYLAQWIERYLPIRETVDGKAAASGEREFDEDSARMGDGRSRSVDQQAGDEIEDGDSHKKTPGATGTVRGSR